MVDLELLEPDDFDEGRPVAPLRWDDDSDEEARDWPPPEPTPEDRRMLLRLGIVWS